MLIYAWPLQILTCCIVVTTIVPDNIPNLSRVICYRNNKLIQSIWLGCYISSLIFLTSYCIHILTQNSPKIVYEFVFVWSEFGYIPYLCEVLYYFSSDIQEMFNVWCSIYNNLTALNHRWLLEVLGYSILSYFLRCYISNLQLQAKWRMVLEGNKP